ncbi:ribonuclease D [Pseudomonas psychrotolerans]|nr:ribonuclease D [Pseudomonas psychrotolerans]
MLRKKVLEALLRTGWPDGDYRLPDNLRGWRRERFGQALLDHLQAQRSTPVPLEDTP